MKSLDNYQDWDCAFYHLGAKGSPETKPFDFSKEEFFVRGTLFALNDPRTLSAFAHWVSLFGKELSVKQIESYLNTIPFDSAWLGYYLDLINKEEFNFLYKYAKSRNELEILHKVKNPDEVLLKWNIYSRPLSETPQKYLHLDKSKNRVF